MQLVCVPRPDKGLGDSNYKVTANYLPIKSFFSGNIFHYDVSAEPATRKNLFKKLWTQLVAENKAKLGNFAFDGSKNLYSATKFKEDQQSFKISLTPPSKEDQPKKKPNAVEKSVTITIKLANTVSMAPLQEYISGRGPYTNDVQLATNVLDIVFRTDPSSRHIPVGAKFYSGDAQYDIGKLSGGLSVKQGLYMSVRPVAGRMALNVCAVHAAFHREISLIDYVAELLSSWKMAPERVRQNILEHGLTKTEHHKIDKALRKVAVSTTHQRKKSRTYSIFALSRDPLSKLAFALDNNNNNKEQHQQGAAAQKSTTQKKKSTAASTQQSTTTVVDYFRKTYGIDLRATKLPAVNVGDSARPVYLPMELCVVVGNRRYPKALSETQVADMIRYTAQRPPALEAATKGLVRAMLNFNNNAIHQAFKVHMDAGAPASFMTVPAHMLPPAALIYKTSQTLTSSWRDSERLRFVAPAAVRGLGIVSFADDRFPMDSFVRGVVKCCESRGMRVAQPQWVCENPRGQSPQAAVENAVLRLSRSLPQKPDLLVFIMPQRDTSMYAAIKRACDCRYGIPSQCVLAQKAGKSQDSYFANVSLKINIKLGGTNWALQKLPRFLAGSGGSSEAAAIVMGADVTHPSPGSCEPSIAAVVASVDKNAVRYISEPCVQGSRVENIVQLREITKTLFRRYHARNNVYPKQCIFYRDGVSEGQFAMAQSEAMEIKKAAEELNISNFKLTFVVVQKRHHTRFSPLPQGSPPVDKSGNFNAGMVVDSVITSPRNFDFFLQSQKGLQGTCRPAHYQVVHDDYGFGSAELYELTFQLCALYERAPTTVKIPAPVYYAHHLCFRSRYRLPYTDDMSMSSGAGSAKDQSSSSELLPALQLLQAPVVDAMYYI